VPDALEVRLFSLFKRKNLSHVVHIEGQRAFNVRPDQTVLDAALDLEMKLPFRCRVGTCGTCRARLLSGQVKQRTDAAYVLSKEDMDDGYILICQSEPRGDLRLSLPE